MSTTSTELVEDPPPPRTEAEVIARLAQQAAEPTMAFAGDNATLVVPEGAHVAHLDFEHLEDTPRRAHGQVRLQTVDDLVKYVQRHDQQEATTVWVDLQTHTVEAVLNDHARDTPGWGDHRAALKLQTTPEWQHWAGKDNVLMGQEAFAQHIEDGLPEIVEPAGATMLEIAQTLQGATKAEWKSAQRLHNGQVQVVYVEEQTASAGGKGELAIPERFKLGISPFVGEEAFAVAARLRYRVRGGDVQLGYKLDRPHEVIRSAIDEIATKLTGLFTYGDGEGRLGSRVFVGTPR